MAEEEFMTMRQAAAYLGISRTTLWSLTREGWIEVYIQPTNRRVKLVRKGDLDNLKQPRPAADRKAS